MIKNRHRNHIIKEKNYSGGKSDGIKNIIGRIRKKAETAILQVERRR